ncbi:hypothetical protein [Catalinimonas niigatensis]|uniref:hypothetical protein n=1 Tax=Catalinimonas niigatensis TaxID=1397264 RepID=UPI00266536DB|nr:hypothetical protein [Catalinimonas niigatensis]WPP52907.1 hypothetical protein PZB72_11020 [Catalinimonas niigatensis]
MKKLIKQVVSRSKVLQEFYNRLAKSYRLIKSSIKPYKSARVYVKKGIDRMEFFDILNKRHIEYVLLRWWDNLPEIPAGEDMDILINDEHRDLIDDLLTYHDNGTGLKCDIYTVAGSRHGSHKSIPYFQSNLAQTLIKTRVLYRGAYVPSPMPYFASLAYHAVFHKGYGSGLPGFDKTVTDAEHDYTTILTDQANSLGLEVKVNARGLYHWLKKQKYAPADDTLSKLVEIRPELSFLQKNLYSDARGGELFVYIVRERLLNDGLLQDFKAFLENKFQFDILDVRVLNAKEKEICRAQIRGGKWDRGPFKYSGGPPVTLVVGYDYHPCPLDSLTLKKQPRTTNRNAVNAKYNFRERLNNLGLRKGHYNGVHSADNEHDAWAYISLIGNDYREKIHAEVEIRRERYARIWGVRKVLSTGPISKVELIKYGQDLAVKKTYRPGKERFFERELFAVKELSKELAFIPPLLKEGDGYVVVPYLENILNALSESEKKQLIASKLTEILNVIISMHARGLAFVNFTPESLIVTPENKLYCTGFSFLQKYQVHPPNIEQAYEVAGLPKDFSGDYPENFHSSLSSYKNVWGDYLGTWRKDAFHKVS